MKSREWYPQGKTLPRKDYNLWKEIKIKFRLCIGSHMIDPSTEQEKQADEWVWGQPHPGQPSLDSEENLRKQKAGENLHESVDHVSAAA